MLSSFFYASYGVWTKLMGDFFGGYTASALRSALVLVILVPLGLAARQLGRLNWRTNWVYLLGLTCTACFIWGPLYYAILQAGVGIGLAVNYASWVLGMFFFGWLFDGERFTRDKMIAGVLGLGGLAIIFSPSGAGVNMLAVGAAAVSGFSSAAHWVIAKKIPYNATQSTVCVWAASVVANIPMAVAVNESLPAAGWHVEWFYLVIFALASIASSWTFIRGVKLIESGAAGILGLLEVVFGVVFGVVLFAERPSLVALVGVVMIIVAAAVPYLREYRSVS